MEAAAKIALLDKQRIAAIAAIKPMEVAIAISFAQTLAAVAMALIMMEHAHSVARIPAIALMAPIRTAAAALSALRIAAAVLTMDMVDAQAGALQGKDVLVAAIIVHTVIRAAEVAEARYLMEVVAAPMHLQTPQDVLTPVGVLTVNITMVMAVVNVRRGVILCSVNHMMAMAAALAHAVREHPVTVWEAAIVYAIRIAAKHGTLAQAVA